MIMNMSVNLIRNNLLKTKIMKSEKEIIYRLSELMLRKVDVLSCYQKSFKGYEADVRNWGKDADKEELLIAQGLLKEINLKIDTLKWCLKIKPDNL